MGASWSAVDIDEPFAVFQQWAHAHSVDMLKKYRENDFDFGIDGKIVAFLIGGDVDRANDIVDRFAVDGSSMCAPRRTSAERPFSRATRRAPRSTAPAFRASADSRACTALARSINALSLLSGIVALANFEATEPSLLEEKIALIFSIFDFDRTSKITLDELTILFLSVLRAIVVFMGQGTEPADHECEQFAIRAYHFVGRDLSTPITRDEFTEYVKSQIGEDCSDLTTLAIAFERLDIPTAPPEPPAEEEAEVPLPEEEDAEDGAEGARGPDDNASPARLLEPHAEAPARPVESPVVVAAAAASEAPAPADTGDGAAAAPPSAAPVAEGPTPAPGVGGAAHEAPAPSPPD